MVQEGTKWYTKEQKSTKKVRTSTKTIQKTTTQNAQQDLKFMAHVRNYECLFCTKKLFIKTFEDTKCDTCGSQWFLKLQDKKVKTVDAV